MIRRTPFFLAIPTRPALRTLHLARCLRLEGYLMDIDDAGDLRLVGTASGVRAASAAPGSEPKNEYGL